jgi:hypothetical protein
MLSSDDIRWCGDRHGLSADWLNDAVKGFLPGPDPAATVLFDRPRLAARVASAPYLFAMKVLAARVERDEDDLQLLYTLCGFRSVPHRGPSAGPSREGHQLIANPGRPPPRLPRPAAR